MRFQNLAAAIVGSVLFAAVSFAQTGAFQGDVIGLDGKPMAGAVIKFHRTDVKQEFDAKTDKKGHYLRMGFPVGAHFVIAVNVDGKDMDSKPARVGIGDPQDVNFDLQKFKAAEDVANKAFNAAAESGGQIPAGMEKGLTQEQKDQIEETLKSKAEAIKKNKDRNEAYGSAQTALDNKQWSEAIAGFQKASELDPTQVAIWSGLADSYLGDAGSKTGADHDAEVQQGIDAYNKAIALKPNDASLHNNYGRALAGAKKYTEAQDEMNKAAQLDPPGAGKYYYNLGAILTNIGQSGPAEEAFRKAIEADPNYADAYYQLGVSLMARATLGADGKITAAPGTTEAFQKCIGFDARCQHLQEAKDALAALGSTVDTSYSDPNKKTTTTKKK